MMINIHSTAVLKYTLFGVGKVRKNVGYHIVSSLKIHTLYTLFGE